MAPTVGNHHHRPHGLKLAAVIIFTVAFFLFLQSGDGAAGESERNMMLGSKPPRCVNKCLSCRPCIATLVIPSNQKKKNNLKSSTLHGDEDNDSYYLLSWKCRCGKKLYQP